MQVHHDYFSEFTIADLIQGRRDGLLYLWNTGSTAWCLVDCVARAAWLTNVGWDEPSGGGKWQAIWLSLHAAGAVIAVLGHVAVNVSLRNVEFCERCKCELPPHSKSRGR